MRGPYNCDGCENWTGARYEQEAEGKPKRETSGGTARLAGADASKGPFDQGAHCGNEVAGSHDDERGDADVAKRVLREMEEREDLGADEHEEAEAQD